MTSLVEHLRLLSKELGLRVEFSRMIFVGKEFSIESLAYFPDLGGRNGMIVVTDFSEVRGKHELISDAGYGFTTLTDPHCDHSDDKVAFIEMAIDWGWTGPEDRRPSWLVEQV